LLGSGVAVGRRRLDDDPPVGVFVGGRGSIAGNGVGVGRGVTVRLGTGVLVGRGVEVAAGVEAAARVEVAPVVAMGTDAAGVCVGSGVARSLSDATNSSGAVSGAY
jgi:hypothetical protein